jgi:hypothetical protein
MQTFTFILGEFLYLFIYLGAGVEPSPLLQKPLIGLLYQYWMVDGVDCRAIRE